MGIDIFEALQMLECGPQFGKPESHLTCQISPSFVLLFHHWYPSCCLPSWQMWWLNDSFYIQIAYAADVFMWITAKVQYVWLENVRTGLLFPTTESPEHASLYAPLQKRNRNLADHNRPRLLLNFSELSVSQTATDLEPIPRKSDFHNLHLLRHRTPRISVESCFLEFWFWFCQWKCCVSDTRIQQFVLTQKRCMQKQNIHWYWSSKQDDLKSGKGSVTELQLG